MGRELSDDIADDIAEIFTDPNDFGRVVTHKSRFAAAVSINGIFVPGGGTDLSADRRNRQQVQGGQLLVGLTTTTGETYELDESGTFTIDGVMYQIADTNSTPGGYVIKLTRENRKTLTSARNS